MHIILRMSVLFCLEDTFICQKIIKMHVFNSYFEKTYIDHIIDEKLVLSIFYHAINMNGYNLVFPFLIL